MRPYITDKIEIHSFNFQAIITAITLVLCLFYAPVSGQQIIVNSNGDRVVIYPDGSWRAYEDSDSSMLNRQMSKEEIYRLEHPPKPYENANDNPEEIRAMIHSANEFADLTMRQSREANRTMSKALDAKFEVEARVQQAQENENLIEPDQLSDLEEELDEKIEVVKVARKHQKTTSKFAADANALLSVPIEKREKLLNKLTVKHSAYYADRDGQVVFDTGYITVDNTPPVASAAVANSNGSATKSNISSSKYETYKRQPETCTAVVNKLDSKGQPEQIVIERKLLFRYTDDDLRPYFREQDLVTCSGQVSSLGENVYLNIEFSIASPNAQKNFGSLAESSMLRLRMMDGTLVDLHNLQGDRGHIDPYSGNTLFIGRYILTKEHQRTLAKTELDKMRVVWQTGYEDYHIYAVDFLIDQLTCLKSYQ